MPHNATGEEWADSSRRNGEVEPERKQRPAVDVTGSESEDAVKNNTA